MRHATTTGRPRNISFQFTHPRRVRHGRGLWRIRALRFNSRTRVGCDRSASRGIAPFYGFNSRTRVGCDLFIQKDGVRRSGFQFTHPRRVRLIFFAWLVAPDKFQFTHPRRVRLLTGRRARISRGFNSRTRVGCDRLAYYTRRDPALFQFTHPRRVRRAASSKRTSSRVFQFTHPRRVRHNPVTPPGSRCRFQFTHPRRVRLGKWPAFCFLICSFNSRTRVGCDHVRSRLCSRFLVSIHAPA